MFERLINFAGCRMKLMMITHFFVRKFTRPKNFVIKECSVLVRVKRLKQIQQVPKTLPEGSLGPRVWMAGNVSLK